MLSQNVNLGLAPCRKMTARNALSPTYRALELGPQGVRAFASYALLEIKITLGIDQTVIVDSGAFLGVIGSLPPNHEFVLEVEEGALSWSCGSARGRLALMTVPLPPPIPTRRAPALPFSPTKEFVTALELGSLSCDNAALGSVGMYGIAIYCTPGGLTTFCSTDNVSISSCQMSLPDTNFERYTGIITLPPEGVELLCTIMAPDGVLEIGTESWYYHDVIRTCLVKQVPALSADILAIQNQYQDVDITAPIPRTQIDAFIKRTSALTENQRNASVGLAASSGQLMLTFKEGLSTTDEFFLTPELEGLPDLPEIQVSAAKTKRALQNVTEVVLNHLERGIVILQNPDTHFSYMLSGRIS